MLMTWHRWDVVDFRCVIFMLRHSCMIYLVINGRRDDYFLCIYLNCKIYCLFRNRVLHIVSALDVLGIRATLFELKFGMIHPEVKNWSTAFSTYDLMMSQKVWKNTTPYPFGPRPLSLLSAKTALWISSGEGSMVSIWLVLSVTKLGITSSTSKLSCKTMLVQKSFIKIKSMINNMYWICDGVSTIFDWCDVFCCVSDFGDPMKISCISITF